MDVYFFTFSKKVNSTAVPTLPLTPTVVCQLKEPCSVLRPILKIYASSQANYTTLSRCNYAYITEFQRFYFISNWTLDGAVAYCALEVDVLGSYKTDIMDSSQYVLRSASNYDGAITDAKYPIRAEMPTVSVASATNPFVPSGTNYGSFIVGVLNNQATINPIDYYAFSYLNFMTFCTQLFTLSNVWGSDTTVVAGIKKAITDPFQYVVSIMWFPYEVDAYVLSGYVESVSSVPIGYDSFTVTCKHFENTVLMTEYTSLVTFGGNDHPQAATRGQFLNFAPYSRYFLSFYPFCGMVELDSSLVGSLSNLYLVYTVDLRTGKGVCNVCRTYGGSSAADWMPGQVIRVLEAQIGVNIPVANIYTALPSSLGQVVLNVGVSAADQFGGFNEAGKKFLSSILGGAGKLIGDAIGGSATGDLMQNYATTQIGAEPYSLGDIAKIATSAAAMNSTAEITGSQGTISLNKRMPLMFWAVHYDVANDATGLNGRPLCQYRQLGGATPLSGYVCCDNPKIAMPSGATAAEAAEIENYLASGCFLE